MESNEAGYIPAADHACLNEEETYLQGGRRPYIHPVLDLAAGAVDVLVEGAGVDLARRQRGHDEARVRAFGQVLGLGHHAPLAAPAVERAPGKIGEAPRRAALGQALGLGLGERFGDRAD